MENFAKLEDKGHPVWTQSLSRGSSIGEKEVWKLV